MFLPFIYLLALPLVHAAAVQSPHDSHDDPDYSHNVPRSLPGTWYHARDHPVHALFKRAPGDGTNYPPVGTPRWSAGFPPAGSVPDPAHLPAEWVAALNAAVAAGKIPDIPRSMNIPQTNPVYPPGVNPNSPQICSATYKCRIPGDIWDSPDGVFASSFDDGPLPATPALVHFLTANNQKTTHFMIGVNILYYPSHFLTAFDADNDIAVHTWSHPYMTTLSNLDIIGQLGWTMQLIHNSTGGRVPKFWRPPYGDSDMRVSAIAKEVFGLQTVVWNQDPSDWSAPATAPIDDNMRRFLTGPKSPGLIILEHEATDITVNGFINSYPLIDANGWTFASLAQIMGDGHSYQNAQSSSSDDVELSSILLGSLSSSSSDSSSSSTSTSGSATSTSTSATSTSQTPSPSASASSALPLRPHLSCRFVLSSLFVVAFSSLFAIFS